MFEGYNNENRAVILRLYIEIPAIYGDVLARDESWFTQVHVTNRFPPRELGKDHVTASKACDR